MVGNIALSLKRVDAYKHVYLEEIDSVLTSNGVVEDEFIFLTECNEYKNIMVNYFSRK